MGEDSRANPAPLGHFDRIGRSTGKAGCDKGGRPEVAKYCSIAGRGHVDS